MSLDRVPIETGYVNQRKLQDMFTDQSATIIYDFNKKYSVWHFGKPGGLMSRIGSARLAKPPCVATIVHVESFYVLAREFRSESI